MNNDLINKRLDKIEDKLNKLDEKLERINSLIEKQILKTYNDNVIHRALKDETIKIKETLNGFENFISENMSGISFHTWILSCDIEETDAEIHIKTPNAFCKGIIEKRYLEICKRYGKEIILT